MLAHGTANVWLIIPNGLLLAKLESAELMLDPPLLNMLVWVSQLRIVLSWLH